MSLLERIKRLLENKASPLETNVNTSNSVEKHTKISSLTARERDVFMLLIEGFTLRETAKQLGIKYSTVNTNMTAIYKKLCVHSRPELIIQYRDFSEQKINRENLN